MKTVTLRHTGAGKPGKRDTEVVRNNVLTRIYPIDDYTIPAAITANPSRVKEYHFLKVPLLGQFNPHSYLYKSERDWCGRTSAAMIYNYHRLLGLPGGETVNSADDYISHYDNGSGDKEWGLDLRFPNGSIAFPGSNYAAYDSAKPDLATVSTFCGRDFATDTRFLFDGPRFDFSNPGTDAPRAAAAKKIGTNETRLRDALSGVIAALEQNNPVLLYSGLSITSFGSHVVVIAGYCTIADSGGRESLWLLIADPGSVYKKIGPVFTPPTDKPIPADPTTGWSAIRNQERHTDYGYLDRLGPESNIIRLNDRTGNYWTDFCLRGQGTLYLLRAAKLFEDTWKKADSFNGATRQCLWMDYLASKRTGGQYRHIGVASEYCPQLVVSNVIGRTCFPFQPEADRLDSPIQYHICTDTMHGGYYPFTRNKAFHGGAHLIPNFPGKGALGRRFELKATGPGQVVAARVSVDLGDLEAEARKKRLAAIKGLAGDVGFVLVKHELDVVTEIAKKDGNEETTKEERAPLYTLYLHLAPIDLPHKDPRAKLPGWLSLLYRARYGSLISLRPDSLGQIHWAAEDVAKKKAAPDDVCAAQGSSEPIVLRQGGRYFAFARDAPDNLEQAYDALAAGMVVTFSQPLLTVQAGDVLGVISPDASADGLFTTGSLHFEVLCPGAGDKSSNAISKLVKAYGLAHENAESIVFDELQDKNHNNYVDEDEFDDVLAGILPVPKSGRLKDQKPFKDFVERYIGNKKLKIDPTRAFGVALRDFFGSPDTFCDPIAKDDSHPADGSADDASRQAVPVALRVSNPHSLAGGRLLIKIRGKAHVLEKETRLLETRTVELGNAANADLVISVPLAAETLEISGDGFHVESRSIDGSLAPFALFDKLTPFRWRQVRLDHKSEWTESGVRNYFEALRKNQNAREVRTRINVEKETEKVKPGAFWGVDATFDVGNPVFAKLLSAEAEIENLHPITALWLVELLQRVGLCSFVLPDEVQHSNDEENEPIFWSWIREDNTPPRLGEAIRAIAISKNHSATKAQLVATHANGHELVAGGDAFDRHGVLCGTAEPTLWGDWTLSVKWGDEANESSGSPEKQGKIDVTTKIAVAEPKAVEGRVDIEHAGDQYRFAAFLAGGPKSLDAVIEYEWAEWQGKGIPAAHWILDYDGQYILGVTSGRLGKHFDWSSYAGVYAADVPADERDPPRVVPELVAATEALASVFGRRLKLARLGADGLEVEFRVASRKSRQSLASLLDDSEKTKPIGDLGCELSKLEEDGQVTGVAIKAEKPAKLAWNKVEKRQSAATGIDGFGRFELEDDLITRPRDGNENAQVTKDLSYKEYEKHTEGDFELSPYLASMVQRLRSLSPSSRFTPLGIVEGGSAVKMKCTNTADTLSKAKAMRSADGEPTFANDKLVTEEGQKHLLLSIDPAKARANRIDFGFPEDDSVLSAAVEEAHLGDDKWLLIRRRVSIPNGGITNLSDHNTPHGQLEYDSDQAVVLTDNKVWITGPTAFRFGEVDLAMDGPNIVVSIDLHGDLDVWRRARPRVRTKAGGKLAASHRITNEGKLKAMYWFFSPGVYDARGDFEVEAAVAGTMKVHGQEIHVGAASGKMPAGTALEGFAEPVEEAGNLVFAGQARFLPVALQAQTPIRCYMTPKLAEEQKKAGLSETEIRSAELEALIEYDHTLEYRGHSQPTCDAKGRFGASLARSHLDAKNSYRFVWGVKGKEIRYHGKTYASEIAELETEWPAPSSRAGD